MKRGDLTVFENVELPLTYRGMSSPARKRRVEAALERGAQAALAQREFRVDGRRQPTESGRVDRAQFLARR